MRYTLFILTFFFVLAGLILNGCQEINQPEANEDAFILGQHEEALAVLNDEYANFTAVTDDSIDADVLFSINWRNMFYPVDSIEVLRSHIFAVSPSQDTTQTAPHHWGYDMGTVSLTYQNGTIDLNKIETRNGGIIYELGRRRPGGHGGHGGPKGHGGRGPGGRGNGGMNPGGLSPDTTTIPFYPGTVYEFSNTGSETIPALTVQATAPNELINITSHVKGDSIDSCAQNTHLYKYFDADLGLPHMYFFRL